MQTSTNVASVEARVESLSRRLQRTRDDLYSGEMRVPNVPAILHRKYTLQLIARNPAGRVTRSYVPVELR